MMKSLLESGMKHVSSVENGLLLPCCCGDGVRVLPLKRCAVLGIGSRPVLGGVYGDLWLI